MVMSANTEINVGWNPFLDTEQTVRNGEYGQGGSTETDTGTY